MYLPNRLSLLATGCLLTGFATVIQPAAAQSSSGHQLEILGLELMEGPLPLYASAGYEQRAEELAAILSEAVEFYARKLGVRPPLALAVLDENDWAAFTPVPYGLPHYRRGEPNLAIMGATADNEAAEDLRVRVAYASPVNLAIVETAGLSWDEAAALTIDLVSLHELGHIYTHALGIVPHNRWFSEMLATYIGYAFMREEQPGLATVWESVLAATMTSPRPDHTSLADFERLYVNVGIPNYGWYQGAFQVRAGEVYDAQGIDFIHRVREALPADASESLSTHDLLARLERIQPGFHAWAERLGLITK
jgi:hypothetical protein